MLDCAVANAHGNGPLKVLLGVGAGATPYVSPAVARDVEPVTGASLLHRAALADAASALDVLLDHVEPTYPTPLPDPPRGPRFRGRAAATHLARLAECALRCGRVADGSHSHAPGCELAARDAVGGTALHAAVATGAVRAVERLLQLDGYGQLLATPDNEGAVALHYAAAAGNTAVLKQLLTAHSQRGVSVDLHDFGGGWRWRAPDRPTCRAADLTVRAAVLGAPSRFSQGARRCTWQPRKATRMASGSF